MAIQSLTHFWIGPQTRLASTAGRVGGNKEIDWLGFSIRYAQRSGLHQPAGPAPHEAFHWLASTVLAISGSCVLGSSMRWILAQLPPTCPSSWCYPPGCRTLNEKKELTSDVALAPSLTPAPLEIPPKGVLQTPLSHHSHLGLAF